MLNERIGVNYGSIFCSMCQFLIVMKRRLRRGVKKRMKTDEVRADKFYVSEERNVDMSEEYYMPDWVRPLFEKIIASIEVKGCSPVDGRYYKPEENGWETN